MKALGKNKKMLIALVILIIAMLSVVIVASVVDVQLNTIEPQFENSTTVLQGIEDGSIYAIFKYDSDTIWYIYKEDRIFDKSNKDVTEQITSI